VCSKDPAFMALGYKLQKTVLIWLFQVLGMAFMVKLFVVEGCQLNVQ
jgi:hypothetical protein